MIDETQIIKEIRKLAADAERGRRRAFRPSSGNWYDFTAVLAYKVRYDNCKTILGIIDRYTSVDDKGGEWVLSDDWQPSEEECSCNISNAHETGCALYG